MGNVTSGSKVSMNSPSRAGELVQEWGGWYRIDDGEIAGLTLAVDEWIGGDDAPQTDASENWFTVTYHWVWMDWGEGDVRAGSELVGVTGKLVLRGW